MSAIAHTPFWLHRLAAAAPSAWHYDPVFRWIGDRRRRRSGGVRSPADGSRGPHRPSSVADRVRAGQPRVRPMARPPPEHRLRHRSPLPSPKIAPGRSLDRVTIAPPPARRFRHRAAGNPVVLEWMDTRCRALASLSLLPASRWPGSHRRPRRRRPRNSTASSKSSTRSCIGWTRCSLARASAATADRVRPASPGVSLCPGNADGRGPRDHPCRAGHSGRRSRNSPPTAWVGSSTPAVHSSWRICPIGVSVIPASPASNGKAGCAPKEAGRYVTRSRRQHRQPQQLHELHLHLRRLAGRSCDRRSGNQPRLDPRAARPPSRSSSAPSCARPLQTAALGRMHTLILGAQSARLGRAAGKSAIRSQPSSGHRRRSPTQAALSGDQMRYVEPPAERAE